MQSHADTIAVLEENTIIEATSSSCTSFRFTHSIMKTIAAESLTAKQRLNLNRVYLDLLESNPTDASFAVLASVAEHAEEFDKASSYYVQAATSLTRAFANKDARDCIEKARGLFLKESEKVRPPQPSACASERDPITPSEAARFSPREEHLRNYLHVDCALPSPNFHLLLLPPI